MGQIPLTSEKVPELLLPQELQLLYRYRLWSFSLGNQEDLITIVDLGKSVQKSVRSCS